MKEKTVDIPSAYMCPISAEIMKDPVLNSKTGHSYENEDIRTWLEKNDSDPLTREKTTIQDLVPNRALAQAIEEFKNPSQEDDSDFIPEAFTCPLSMEIMREPVMNVKSGHTYEKEIIEQWLVKNNTDPQTRDQTTLQDLVPNRALAQAISEFQEQKISAANENKLKIEQNLEGSEEKSASEENKIEEPDNSSDIKEEKLEDSEKKGSSEEITIEQPNNSSAMQDEKSEDAEKKSASEKPAVEQPNNSSAIKEEKSEDTVKNSSSEETIKEQPNNSAEKSKVESGVENLSKLPENKPKAAQNTSNNATQFKIEEPKPVKKEEMKQQSQKPILAKREHSYYSKVSLNKYVSKAKPEASPVIAQKNEFKKKINFSYPQPEFSRPRGAIKNSYLPVLNFKNRMAEQRLAMYSNVIGLNSNLFSFFQTKKPSINPRLINDSSALFIGILLAGNLNLGGQRRQNTVFNLMLISSILDKQIDKLNSEFKHSGPSNFIR